MRDPLKYLAQLAGYSDSERWWEATFEQNDHSQAVFEVILDMMTALRTEVGRVETQETLLREAYMRKIIRKTLKEGAQRVAVVCGAWHAPVLHNYQNFKEKADNDALKGLKKVATQATWVPWSYPNLSLASGYAAGIVSPAWYELLYRHRETATLRWLTQAARLLRQEDISAGVGHTIEAVRLAETVAILRGLSIPGLEELEEAAISLYCSGSAAPMALIRQKLVVGTAIGFVPADMPQVPLQKDMEAAIKSARLTKEYATTEAVTKELDLRKDTQLAASQLLHRLALLSIPWGKPQKVSRYTQGSFKEIWKLHWKPDYAVRLIEAAQWGNTVAEAATRVVQNKVAEATLLTELTALLEHTLAADLPQVWPFLIQKLQEYTALTHDVLVLMQALPPLVGVVKYGNVRGSNADTLAQVLSEMVPRIVLGVPALTHQIDDTAAHDILQHLQQAQNALFLSDEPAYMALWERLLQQLAAQIEGHGLIKGHAVRSLFDRQVLSTSQTAIQMRFALSASPRSAAAWLEGFLDGSALLLLHHEALWFILDEWVSDTDMAEIQALLPLIRRTFSKFSAAERQKIGQLAWQSASTTEAPPQYLPFEYEAGRAAAVLATLSDFI